MDPAVPSWEGSLGYDLGVSRIFEKEVFGFHRNIQYIYVYIYTRIYIYMCVWGCS
jgi:hypothetical protein